MGGWPVGYEHNTVEELDMGLPRTNPDSSWTRDLQTLAAYTCQLSRLRRESHAYGLKTSISRRLTLAGQFLTPDWKMWVVAVLFDTISKNMLTQTHVRNENHV